MKANKILFTFLNILLVIGVILSIVTIDRGRWITDYLIFLSSGEVGGSHTLIQNTHANGTQAKPSAPVQGACVVENQLAAPQWYDTYLLVSQYNKADLGGTTSASGAETSVICGK